MLSQCAVNRSEYRSTSLFILVITTSLNCVVSFIAAHICTVGCNEKPKPRNIVLFTRTGQYSVDCLFSNYLEHIYLPLTALIELSRG